MIKHTQLVKILQALLNICSTRAAYIPADSLHVSIALCSLMLLFMFLPCSLTSMASFGASHHIAHVGPEKITPKPGYRTWLVSITVKTLLHFLQDSNTTCFKEISVNRATKSFFFLRRGEEKEAAIVSIVLLGVRIFSLWGCTFCSKFM